MEQWRRFLKEKKFSDYSGGQKNKWIDLPHGELKSDPENVDIADELFALIDKSYADIGGHADFRTVADIPDDSDIWLAIDVDKDPDPDALRVGKKKPAGSKMTAGASDGSNAAKDVYLTKTVELLNTQGNYAEMSHAIAHIMIKYNDAPFVDNEEDVRKVLGKDIRWIGPHPDGKYPNHPGWYERMLGGKLHLKILLGKPNGVKT
jgi:hypothetical protein